METRPQQFWWMKKPSPDDQPDTSSSLADFQKLESLLQQPRHTASEPDIASILEEIDRVAAQSPLGPFEKQPAERSVEDIMREAERIFAESSKSFEQLSGRSKATSRNITEIDSKNSTPTPKSVSPLPQDEEKNNVASESESYSEDFSLADDGKTSIVLETVENRERSESFVLEEDGRRVDDATFVVGQQGQTEGFRDETALRLLEIENEQLKKDVELMQVSSRKKNETAKNMLAT